MKNKMFPVDSVESEDIEITVRQAEETDARAIIGLSRHLGKETDYLSFGKEGLLLTVAEERAIINSYQAAPTSILLLTETDGQIIGLSSVKVLDQGKQAHVAEIGVSLIEEYWGYGIGHMMLTALIEFAQAVDIKVLTLEVITVNQRAIKLYQKNHFDIVGRLTKRVKSAYGYYDTYIMERILD